MKNALTVLGLAATCAALTLPASAQGYERYRQHGGGRDAGRIHWSGTVDNTAVIVLRDGNVQTRNVAGSYVRDVRTDVQGRLPDRPTQVRLREIEGRGDVRIVEEPNARNGYTTRVRIDDPQGGGGHYAFSLVWGGGGRRGF